MKDLGEIVRSSLGELRSMVNYWRTYPALENDQEVCAYYRTRNKKVPMAFISFSASLLLIHILRTIMAVLRREFIYVHYVLPYWLIIDATFLPVFVYTMYLKRSATAPKNKQNLVFQLGVYRRLRGCCILSTAAIVLSAVLPIYQKDGSYSLVWVLGMLLEFSVCTTLTDTLAWKTVLMLIFDASVAVASYHNGNITESLPKHIVIPVVAAVLIFVSQGRNDYEGFLLKRLLKSQKDAYECFLQKLKDPAIMVGRDSEGDKLMFFNEAARQEIGMNPENFYQKAGNIISPAGRSLEECIKSKLDRTETNGDLVRQDKFFMHDEDSEVIKCDRILMVTLIVTTFSSSMRMIALIMRDVTKELDFEEQRIEAHYKNIMLFSLSHELRTPLNILQDAIWMRKKSALNPEDRLKINSAKGAWRYLKNKISDALDYSQIMTGEFVLHPSRFSLKKLFQYLQKMTSFLLRQKSSTIDLKFTVDKRIQDRIEADKERLEQVLFNLLINAVKYTSTGTISLTITWSPLRPEAVNFEVSDTGCGMSEETVQSLLKTSMAQVERHKNLEESRCQASTDISPLLIRTPAKSAGLGLTVSRMICQKMGSDIRIASIPGKGSAFMFTVQGNPSCEDPVRDEEDSVPSEKGRVALHSAFADAVMGARRACVQSQESASKTKDLRARPATVLIVDDNEMNREVVCRMVKRYGFSIIEAENGLVAVNKYRTAESDGTRILVLMDIDMPVMDGIDATKEIRKLQLSPRPYICALTAYASEPERRRALDAGMDDFLSKPLTKDNLVELLRKLSFIF